MCVLLRHTGGWPHTQRSLSLAFYETGYDYDNSSPLSSLEILLGATAAINLGR